jgi:hypothetical protein
MEEVIHVVTPHDAQVTISGEPKITDEIARDQGAFIEMLDKHDSVLQRIRFDRLPITIGNSYRCDHIVDGEDGVASQSVTLDHDPAGLLVVRVAENADAKFWAPGGMTREWTVDPDRAFIVAGERIRVRTRDYAASRRASAGSAIAWLGGWMTLIAVALALGVTALQGWIADIDGDRLANYVTGALGVFGLISIWSGIWAVVSRLNGKSSHFLAHLSLTALAVVAISTVDFLFDSLAYGLNLPWFSRYGYVVFALCIAILVWCHTRYVVRTRTSSAVVTAFAIGLAVFAMQATTFYNLRGNLASSLTMNEMRPPAWRLANGSGVEEFFTNSAKLEKLAEDSKPEKPEGFDFSQYGE